MSRKHLITLLKLALVGAIMVVVFTSIQWTDRITHVASDGETVRSVLEGRILGDWDDEVIRFRPRAAGGADTARVLERRPGEQPDGSTIEVSPGFPTFLRGLDLLLFLAGAFCYFGSVVVASTRWWWLLRVNDLNVRWHEAQRFTWIGCFFNNVVPGQTGGDVVKALYVMKHCEGGRLRALVSVAVDRILGLGSLALMCAIVVLFAVDRFRTVAVGIWTLVGAVAVLGVVAFSRRIRRWIRLEKLLNKLPPFLRGPLQRIDQAIFFYRAHKKGIFVWLLIGMLNHAMSVSCVVLIGTALGLGLPGAGVPAYDYYVLVPGIIIFSAIPLGPNGWGVGEVAYAIAFGTYCAGYLQGVGDAAYVMRTQAVALSVLYRVHLTLWSLLGGLLMLFGKDRVTRAEFEQEIAREEEEARRRADDVAVGAGAARPAGSRAESASTSG